MGAVKTHCLIVNYKNVKDFKNLVFNLLKQDTEFLLTIVDQNSNVPALTEFYKSLEKHDFIDIVYNDHNKPLNHIWNWFSKHSKCDYLAYLNNDIRIPSNFISDSEKIFEKESEVGITIHVTNSEIYFKKMRLNYKILDEGWQGWDFTVRRSMYDQIPEKLLWFGGDAHIFEGVLYRRNKKLAFIFSSPIIHHQGLTKTPERSENRVKDSQTRRDMKAPTPPRDEILKYTNIKPTSKCIARWEKENA